MSSAAKEVGVSISVTERTRDITCVVLTLADFNQRPLSGGTVCGVRAWPLSAWLRSILNEDVCDTPIDGNIARGGRVVGCGGEKGA
jgi:hypothetical protein